MAHRPYTGGRNGAGLRNLEQLISDAATAGQSYILCPSCTAKEDAGFATDPLCRYMSFQLREPGPGWHDENLVLVCCREAQLLRGRKPDESERIANKFERAAAAASAADAGETLAAGRKCESPSCTARELFAGAFKRCGKCLAVCYGSAACQVRLAAASYVARLPQVLTRQVGFRRRRTGSATSAPTAQRASTMRCKPAPPSCDESTRADACTPVVRRLPQRPARPRAFIGAQQRQAKAPRRAPPHGVAGSAPPQPQQVSRPPPQPQPQPQPVSRPASVALQARARCDALRAATAPRHRARLRRV
jgi:hypothetical protein